MDRFNRVRRHPSRYDFQTTTLIPLRVFNIVSLILGVLTLSVSAIYHASLKESSVDEVFQGNSTSDNIHKNNNNACQKCSDWKVFLISVIIVSVLQTLVDLMSIIWRWAESQTNVWCAIHALVLVVFSPIFIFSLVSCSSDTDTFLDVLSTGKQKLFVGIVGADLCFSLVALVAISSIYGLEVQLNYRRLLSANEFTYA